MSYFFPVVFAIPLFGNHLATQWLWTFTPSLSYIGQGKPYGCSLWYSRRLNTLTGIIMGLPTTVSMNLVRIRT
jgi:hypothetical protein